MWNITLKAERGRYKQMTIHALMGLLVIPLIFFFNNLQVNQCNCYLVDWFILVTKWYVAVINNN